MLTTHALLIEAMDDEMQREQGLPLTSYDALVHLSEAPDGRMRMSDLAERVLLTRSGLTRVADTLEQQGLIRRVRAEQDARGYYAHITRAGRAKLRLANRAHLASVRMRFINRLSDEQVATLAQSWRAVLGDQAKR